MSFVQHLGSLALTAKTIAPLMGARCVRSSEALITNVQIDSRACTSGSLFFALPGAHVDGFSFIGDAARNGAVAIVVDDRVAEAARAIVDVALLAASDVLAALQALATSYVAMHRSATLIGITGSVGKTTTKEALATILSAAGETAKTPGNYNSVYGLPLSVFSLSKESRWGVFELGIDHHGEMDQLVSLLRPDVALLTNIGISHLAQFGSTEATAKEKAKIFHPQVSQGFITKDCTHRSLIEASASIALHSYSRTDIEAIDLGLGGWLLTYQGNRFSVRTVGKHLLEDVIGAIKVAESLGIDAKTIAFALQNFAPIPGRTSVSRGAITIVDDTYNASLDSTASILGYLSALSWQGAKRVVLGPMKELGNESERAHRTIGSLLARSSFSQTYLYGKEMYAAREELKRHSYAGSLSWTESFEELQERVGRETQKGDLVLLKGSRSVAIDRLVPSLVSRWDSYG